MKRVVLGYVIGVITAPVVIPLCLGIVDNVANLFRK